MNVKECPYCKSRSLSRIPRKGWMHFIPGSKRYDCMNCQAEVITVIQMLKIGLSEGQSKLINLNKLIREAQVSQKIS